MPALCVTSSNQAAAACLMVAEPLPGDCGKAGSAAARSGIIISHAAWLFRRGCCCIALLDDRAVALGDLHNPVGRDVFKCLDQFRTRPAYDQFVSLGTLV